MYISNDRPDNKLSISGKGSVNKLVLVSGWVILVINSETGSNVENSSMIRDRRRLEIGNMLADILRRRLEESMKHR